MVSIAFLPSWFAPGLHGAAVRPRESRTLLLRTALRRIFIRATP